MRQRGTEIGGGDCTGRRREEIVEERGGTECWEEPEIWFEGKAPLEGVL